MGLLHYLAITGVEGRICRVWSRKQRLSVQGV